MCNHYFFLKKKNTIKGIYNLQQENDQEQIFKQLFSLANA